MKENEALNLFSPEGFCEVYTESQTVINLEAK